MHVPPAALAALAQAHTYGSAPVAPKVSATGGVRFTAACPACGRDCEWHTVGERPEVRVHCRCEV